MTDLSFYNGKNVFITGHTGFKGTWLANILILAGANVTGFAKSPSTTPSLFSLTGTEKKIKSIIGDVRDRETLRAAVATAKPEIVLHLAAQPLVRLSYREPVETYETNVMGTVNILEAVRAVSSVKSFVNVTTDKVYENKEWLWGYRENENLNGFDPYSNSKSCSELVTASYRNSFFQADNAPAISTARSVYAQLRKGLKSSFGIRIQPARISMFLNAFPAICFLRISSTKTGISQVPLISVRMTRAA